MEAYLRRQLGQQLELDHRQTRGVREDQAQARLRRVVHGATRLPRARLKRVSNRPVWGPASPGFEPCVAYPAHGRGLGRQVVLRLLRGRLVEGQVGA